MVDIAMITVENCICIWVANTSYVILRPTVPGVFVFRFICLELASVNAPVAVGVLVINSLTKPNSAYKLPTLSAN